MSQTIEINAVITYDKDTDKFDILLFDNAEAAPELIQMKEAEARYKHGWVTVQGADTAVVKRVMPK